MLPPQRRRPYANQVRAREAANGQEALPVLGPTPVLPDLNTSVMSGLAFLKHAHHIWPPARRTATKFVLVSSSTERVSERQQAAALSASFEPKLLAAGTLARGLQQQLGAALAD